ILKTSTTNVMLNKVICSAAFICTIIFCSSCENISNEVNSDTFTDELNIYVTHGDSSLLKKGADRVIDSLYTKALDMYGEGDLEGALINLNKCISIHTNAPNHILIFSPDFYMMRGHIN